MVARVALALVHHPVLGREGQVLTTTVTTLDLHDLARCARAYGLERLYAVHPLASQRALTDRIRSHWVSGSGRRRIPDRGEALALLRTVCTLDDACLDLVPGQGRAGVELWTTAASPRGASVTSFAAARRRLAAGERPVVLCFGTGWGLAPELLAQADCQLEPVRALADTAYNHLSVRAACAITLDRLLGPG
jgi:hypothetical protein